MSTVKRNLFATSVAAAMTLAPVAHADQWKAVGEFGWFGVGKAPEVEKGHFFWSGEFSGTFFIDKGAGSFIHHAGLRCPGWNDLNFAAGKAQAGGYCIVKDADGDQLTGSWEATGTPGLIAGTFSWVSGTGKYAAAKGTYPFKGEIYVNWGDGTVSGFSTWNR